MYYAGVSTILSVPEDSFTVKLLLLSKLLYPEAVTVYEYSPYGTFDIVQPPALPVPLPLYSSSVEMLVNVTMAPSTGVLSPVVTFTLTLAVVVGGVLEFMLPLRMLDWKHLQMQS